MLQVQAVLPGVKAIGVRIVKIDSRAEIGQRTQRIARGQEDAAAEGIRQGIVRGEIVVLSCDQRGSPAEAVLSADIVTGLCEAAKTAAHDGILADLVSEPAARLPFVEVGIGYPPAAPVPSCQKDDT